MQKVGYSLGLVLMIKEEKMESKIDIEDITTKISASAYLNAELNKYAIRKIFRFSWKHSDMNRILNTIQIILSDWGQNC